MSALDALKQQMNKALAEDDFQTVHKLSAELQLETRREELKKKMREATENEDFDLVGQLAMDLQRLSEGEAAPPETSPSPQRTLSHSTASTNERIMSVASPSTPNYHASVASPSLPAAASTNVDITVPNGIFPGQKLAVKLVDGREVEVLVPLGMQAGQVFRVSVPTATGAASAEDVSSTSPIVDVPQYPPGTTASDWGRPNFPGQTESSAKWTYYGGLDVTVKSTDGNAYTTKTWAGYGRVTYSNGHWSEGHFKENKLWSGRVLLFWPRGDGFVNKMRVVNYHNGKKEGDACATWTQPDNSRTAYSKFKYLNNNRTGSCTTVYSDGACSESEWDNDQQHGLTVYTQPSGFRREIEFRRGKKHGRFQQKWPDNGRPTALTSICHYANGVRLSVCERSYRSPDGGVHHYKGHSRTDAEGFYASITGAGTWILPNGDSFDIIGDGSDDNFLTVKITSSGPPESYLVSRDTYNGPRNDAGAKHGDGELVTTAGAVYKGSFENGKKHGQATVTYPNGDIFTGTYNQGERVEGGSLVLSNGDIYSGEWARDEDWYWKPHGRGTFQKASSTKSKPCVCVATRGKSIQFKSFSMTAMCSGCLVM